GIRVFHVTGVQTCALPICNVDIYKFMRQAFWRMKAHRVTGGRMAIYCNHDVLEALDADSTPTTSTGAANTPVRLRPMEVDGFEVMSYRGIPVRQVDAIVNTEARVIDETGS